MPVEKLKLTTVVDNAVKSGGLLAEWGFSLFIETDQLNLLFDCGATTTPFFNNIQFLNIELASINKIIISHGHNDHTGCLDTIIKSMPLKPEIICGTGGWHPRFYEKRWAGITHKKEYIQSLGAKLLELQQNTHLSKDIICIVNIPMHSEFESIDENLYAYKNGNLIQDTFEDELAVAINTEKGLVIITGCAHRGIVNIVNQATKYTGSNKVHAVIGGSHLMNASQERIDKTVLAFKEMGVEKIVLSHCTGDQATVNFSETFGERFIFNKAGQFLDLL